MKTIGWNVDTQYDFMKSDGKLYVEGAEEIIPALKQVTQTLRENNVQIVNTMDYHTKESREIASGEFPEHCMEGTKGAEYIEETKPENAYVINHDDESVDLEELAKQEGDIVITKDEFDVFHKTGAKHTKQILDTINPDRVIVYGVATDYCVNYAVQGLLKEGLEVYVVSDAMKGIAEESTKEAIESWKGAKFIEAKDLEELL
jgi:nicotinamidase/pyrazinamidase